ncbi:hypothetical protein VM1G_08531 [Cytospora mali]|uniref:Uncharacterized protein n=1 Tax=Cytospora mali TaxID=578113 RepID=A0A194W8Y2_CYTMA|nr:hypothetical protein VM1G_08531 [Valsa mali]
MAQQPNPTHPYEPNDDDDSCHSHEELNTAPPIPLIQVASKLPDFFPVRPHKTHRVDEVSTCRLYNPTLNSDMYTSDDDSHVEIYQNLVGKLLNGIPFPRPGFWRINDSLITDAKGFAKVYEFEGLSFDVYVSCEPQGIKFDIGTRDVSDVLTFIENELSKQYEPGYDGIYKVLTPPYSGDLLCKGLFVQGEVSPNEEIVLAPNWILPPASESLSQYTTIRWRVGENTTESSMRYDLDSLEQPHRYEDEGIHDSEWDEEGYAYDDSDVDDSDVPAAEEHRFREESQLQDHRQMLGVGEPLGQVPQPQNTSQSRARHPGAYGRDAESQPRYTDARFWPWTPEQAYEYSGEYQESSVGCSCESEE